MVQSDVKVTCELLVWLESLGPLSSLISRQQKGVYLHVENVILSLEYLYYIIDLLNILTLTPVKGYHYHNFSRVNSCLIKIASCPPLNSFFPFG